MKIQSIKKFLLFKTKKVCNFTKRIGSTFPLLEHPEFSSKWFQKFQNLGTTDTYNWKRLSQEVRQREKKVENSVEAFPAKVQEVYQVVGCCGKGSVRTEMFFIEGQESSIFNTWRTSHILILLLICCCISDYNRIQFWKSFQFSKVLKYVLKKYFFFNR